MPTLNLDKLKQKKAECSAAIVTAMKEQDENKLDAALDGYSQFISEAVQTELAAAGNGRTCDARYPSAYTVGNRFLHKIY